MPIKCKSRPLGSCSETVLNLRAAHADGVALFRTNAALLDLRIGQESGAVSPRQLWPLETKQWALRVHVSQRYPAQSWRYGGAPALAVLNTFTLLRYTTQNSLARLCQPRLIREIRKQYTQTDFQTDTVQRCAAIRAIFLSLKLRSFFQLLFSQAEDNTIYFVATWSLKWPRFFS